MLKKRIKSARHAMSATRAQITFVFENLRPGRNRVDSNHEDGVLFVKGKKSL